MQKKVNNNKQKGSISLFVLLSMLFFLVIVTAISISNKNRENDLYAKSQMIKSSYEKNIGNEDMVYAKMN